MTEPGRAHPAGSTPALSGVPQSGSPHVPVMLDEVLADLAPHDGSLYVDATFGAGGYSRAILAAAACDVVAIDRDPGAIAAGTALVREMNGRLRLVHGRFGAIATLLGELGIGAVDGIVFDIGVSSMQIDQANRGFSFAKDGPLDMRMDAAEGQAPAHMPTAADLINTLPEAALADAIYALGEERHARRVARAIVAARQEAPIQTTGALARIVRAVVRPSKDGIDPATRTFQALRILVNDELDELDRALDGAEALLRAGGRLVVVSFHSLEDRRVKTFLRTRSGGAPRASRFSPDAMAAPDLNQAAPTFTLLTRSARKPGEAECRRNPRARSARLRAAIRTDAPAGRQPIRPSAEGGRT